MGQDPTLIIGIDHAVKILDKPGDFVALGDVVLRRAVTGELQIQWFGDMPQGMEQRLEQARGDGHAAAWHKATALSAASIRAERNAILAYLARTRIDCVADGDTRYGSFVEGLENAIRNGEHYATLQDGEASSRSPEASADSIEKPSSSGSEGESG